MGGTVLSRDFIVRIYRRDGNNPHTFVGLVEEVGVRKAKRAFTSYDELWNILCCPPMGCHDEDGDTYEEKF